MKPELHEESRERDSFWANVAIVLFALSAMVIPLVNGATQQLQFDRTLILGGQWHRLLTGHLTHFGSSHLLWDVVVLVAVGVVAAAIDGRRTIAAMALAAIAIPLAVLWLQPQLAIYRGLSGIDSALFGLVATMLLVRAIRERRWAVAAVVQVGIISFFAKTAYELWTGQTVFVEAASAGFVGCRWRT